MQAARQAQPAQQTVQQEQHVQQPAPQRQQYAPPPRYEEQAAEQPARQQWQQRERALRADGGAAEGGDGGQRRQHSGPAPKTPGYHVAYVGEWLCSGWLACDSCRVRAPSCDSAAQRSSPATSPGVACRVSAHLHAPLTCRRYCHAPALQAMWLTRQMTRPLRACLSPAASSRCDVVETTARHAALPELRGISGRSRVAACLRHTLSQHVLTRP